MKVMPQNVSRGRRGDSLIAGESGGRNVIPVIPSYASRFALTVFLATASTPAAFVPVRRRPTATWEALRHRATGEGADASSSVSVADLPDYGSTPVDVDTIRLEKVARWRRPDLAGQTLVDQTLTELAGDTDFQETATRLADLGLEGMSKEERTRRRRALDALGVPAFERFVADKTNVVAPAALTRNDPEVLQLNIGIYCNQACAHCHVESSPLRKDEMMEEQVAARCLELLTNSPTVHTLDITGGAPELNKSFRYLVSMARSLRPDLDIIDRCNLTVLHEPGQEDLVDFLKEHRVHVIASLPCYSVENVDTQRGNGVFERSISALLALNEAGYGTTSHPELKLDLVYNPLGAFLPPPQKKLESMYKEKLDDNYGIVFNSLFTMTNLPVKRFADFLHKRGELQEYMDLLVRNFNRETLTNLMCLNTVSISYDGKIFDCDFNQQLGYGVGEKGGGDGGGRTIFDIGSLSDLKKDPIRTDNHCFGCTAGMGSS